MPLYRGSRRLILARRVAATTTLDPANTSANFTLSGGNLVATQNSAGNDLFSRSVASHATGKFYFSGVNVFSGGSDNAFGLLDGSQPVGIANFLGDSVHSIGYFPSGNVFFNNVNVGPIASYVTGDVIDTAVDIGALKVWFRKNGGNWNNDILANQNPATGAGGLSISGISTPLFAVIASDALGGAVMTVNFGATAYSFAAPVGYSNW